ncbi:glycosyltransferase [Clostridium perfringens]|uniref:glycosyltransferase n=1 Tax=Clostridium perfringens TaxID=1502 RepID=UPI00123FB750|nr:glycosyltransferase [Clostridium perfringens]MCX0355075.1 glycosyltransferase [Clostridium perfringens]MDM0611819.1 glycosyltransferase [Clostridium perfringens]
MKKLLFMVSSMNIGGVEKSLLSLLSTISREKYEITVLLLEKKGGFLNHIPSWIKVEDVSWFKEIKSIIMEAPQLTFKNYINKRRYIDASLFVFSYFIDKYFKNRYFYYKNILRSIPIKEEEYDVAIAYAGPTEIIDSYITHKVKAKKKIGWVHFDISKHKINTNLYLKLYSKMDGIFIVSKEGKDRFDEKFPKLSNKSTVFKNIISKEVIRKMACERVDFDNSFKGIKIVTVGRLSIEKGQDLGIKALAKLKEDGYEVRWYCIGEGNSRTKYEEIIKEYKLQDDFILLGAKTNPYPYMKMADIYVQTSRHEGYCLTLAEAKVLNKRIITTNFVGAKEQIKQYKTGKIVESNWKSIYENIKYLINNKSEIV